MRKILYSILLILVIQHNVFATKLVNENCLPCDQATLLQPQEILELMKEIDQWHINDASHLYKEYQFPDFVGAINFANKVTEISEKE